MDEAYVVVRLAEVYLIRAEASAQLNDMSSSEDDINLIRNRAGLPAFHANSDPELMLEIEKERQRELFAEWGQRWLDLKRTGRANAVLSLIKPNWKGTDTLFPLPLTEIRQNINLSQNPGY